MAELQVDVTNTPRGIVVKVAGHAGYLEAERLHQAIAGLMAERPKLVVFDLAGLTFIASLAMSTMTNLRRGLERDGGVVKIAAPPPLILEALQAAGMNELFEITPSVDAAFA